MLEFGLPEADCAPFSRRFATGGPRPRESVEVDATDIEDHQQIAIVFHPFGFFLENLNLSPSVYPGGVKLILLEEGLSGAAG